MADQLGLNSFGYKWEALVVMNLLKFFIAILKAWLPQFLSLGVDFL